MSHFTCTLREGDWRLGACLVFLVTACLVRAQAQPSTGGGDETVRLSAFEVTSAQDFGYRATNSITATGIGTEIYRTPITVSVVTKDLITDIGGAGVLREALQYTAGVTTDSRDPNQYVTRGFLAPVLVNRMGSTARNPVSDFVERAEVVKGPNSVFFGRVAPGGVINLITLRPGSQRETRLKLVGGSYDYGRAVIDHSQPITPELSVRVAGSFLNRDDGYYDWTYHRQNAGYLALTWQLGDNVVLNLHADYLDARMNQPHSGARSDPEYLADPANNAMTIAAWGAIHRTPFGKPTITTFADDVAYLNGDHGNNSGPENYKEDLASNVQAELVIKPTDWLSLRLAAAHSDVEIETLETSGFPTPDGTFLDQRAAFFGSHPRATVYEGEAVAEFSTGPVAHRLLAGARSADTRDRIFSVNSNPTTWNNKTMGPRRLTQQFATWPVVPASYTDSDGSETAFYTAYQAGLFGEALKLLAGVRYTEVENRTNTGQRTFTSHDTTPQVGVMWEPIPAFALFANYSRTFEPQFQVDVFGNLAPNVEGEGKEAGLKTNYLDGKLSGTISIFEVRREGEARRDFLRELALGVSPIFIAGGASRTRGTELELTFTPARNYQALFVYTWLWESEVIRDTASPILVGRRLAMSPEHQIALWQRYTFVGGPLKNVTIGGGIRHQHNTQATLQPIFGLKLEDATPVDAFVAYETRLSGRPVKYQLNVKNVFDEKYHDSSSLLADPLTAYVSAEFRF